MNEGGKMRREESRGGDFFTRRWWKRGILVGKREGNCTPSPSWNFGLIKPDGLLIQDSNIPTNRKPNLSARKLGAHLWEVQSHPKLRVANMSRYGPGFNHFGEEARGVFRQVGEAQSETFANQQSSGISLRNQVEVLLAKHSQRVKRAEQTQQPVSPSSYRSSLEMVPSRTAFTSNCSLNSHSEMGESSYTLRTNTDLLKVLNRIWSLEERHALDMSLVNMLKRELNESQSRIKELLQGKRKDKQELGDASKTVAGNKVSRKNKEPDRVKDLVKSVEVKLEDERKLRQYSENICNKRVRELSATKVLLHDALKELELERKRRAMLEDLCDEFASGIREYEQQVRFLKQQSSVDQIGRNGDSGLIHVSESWLDERMQMKLADDNNVKKTSVLDRLSSELEIFLGGKRSGCAKKCDYVSSRMATESNIFRHSLESIHLNDPPSAPWNANEEDDSDYVGVHFSQLSRVGSLKSKNGFGRSQEVEITSDDHPKETDRLRTAKKLILSGKAGKGGFNWPRAQARSQEFVREREHQLGNKDSSKASVSNTDETYNARIRRITEVMERVSSRNHSWASEIKKPEYEDNHMDHLFDPSIFTNPHSPVKKWISEATTAHPNILGSSSSSHRTSKPKTLKAKLLEARLERQQSSARAPKDLSQVD